MKKILHDKDMVGAIRSIDDLINIIKDRRSKEPEIIFYKFQMFEPLELIRKWTFDAESKISATMVHNLRHQHIRFSLNDRHFKISNRNWYLFDNYLYAYRVSKIYETKFKKLRVKNID